MERYVAIDNVCAWPNRTQLPGGVIVATLYNQPCHGTPDRLTIVFDGQRPDSLARDTTLRALPDGSWGMVKTESPNPDSKATLYGLGGDTVALPPSDPN
jgi:hypothetical protein